jgi:hypothetical protein
MPNDEKKVDKCLLKQRSRIFKDERCFYFFNGCFRTQLRVSFVMPRWTQKDVVGTAVKKSG